MSFFTRPFPIIEEARENGRGLNFPLEILKFASVFCVIEMIMDVVGGVIAEAVFHISAVSTAVMLYEEIIGIGLAILFCRVAEKRKPTSMGFCAPRRFSQYLIGLGVGFAMFSLAVLIGAVVGGFRYEGLFEEIKPLSLLLYFVGFMIQGMYEEVIFRGCFMVSVARKNPVWLAAVLNAALFSLVHIMNNGFTVLPAVNIFLFGLFASVYMLKTGNIWGVGAIHAVWNFVQGCFYGFSVSGMPMDTGVFVFSNTDRLVINGGAFGPEGGICVTVVCLLGIAAVFVWDKKSEK